MCEHITNTVFITSVNVYYSASFILISRDVLLQLLRLGASLVLFSSYADHRTTGQHAMTVTSCLGNRPHKRLCRACLCDLRVAGHVWLGGGQTRCST